MDDSDRGREDEHAILSRRERLLALALAGAAVGTTACATSCLDLIAPDAGVDAGDGGEPDGGEPDAGEPDGG